MGDCRVVAVVIGVEVTVNACPYVNKFDALLSRPQSLVPGARQSAVYVLLLRLTDFVSIVMTDRNSTKVRWRCKQPTPPRQRLAYCLWSCNVIKFSSRLEKLQPPKEKPSYTM
jgi:hypothetical protein